MRQFTVEELELIETIDRDPLSVTNEQIRNMTMLMEFRLSDAGVMDSPVIRERIGKVCYMAFMNKKPLSALAWYHCPTDMKNVLRTNFETSSNGDYIRVEKQLTPEEIERNERLYNRAMKEYHAEQGLTVEEKAQRRKNKIERNVGRICGIF